MSAYVPIAELATSVFPFGACRREFMTLKAYLDDSGTHDDSDVIVMAGLIASDWRWAELEQKWSALLTKYEIEPAHAHMNRCKHRSALSFDGWSDLKRLRALTEFRRAIIDTKGRMLAASVSRKAWKGACAKSELGMYFQDPIDLLQAECLRKALETRNPRILMGDRRVSVTFDKRVQSLVSWNWMTLGFIRNAADRFAGYSFGESDKVLPLQAADMIAYESFVFQCDCEKFGRPIDLRPNFSRLWNNLDKHMGFFTQEQLIHYANSVDAGLAAKFRGR